MDKTPRVLGTSSDRVVVLKSLCSLRPSRGQGSRAPLRGVGQRPTILFNCVSPILTEKPDHIAQEAQERNLS